MDIINTGISTIDSGVSTISNVLELINNVSRIKKDTNTFLRLLYIQTCQNLEILNILNAEAIKSKKPNDPIMRKLLDLMQLEVLEAVFYDSSEEKDLKLYEKLKKRGKVKNSKNQLRIQDKGTEKLVKQKYIYENILQAISFVVIKVNLLKSLSTLTEEESELISNMRVNIRIFNIRERLVMIKESLGQMDEVKDMAR